MKNSISNDLEALTTLFVAECDDLCYSIDDDDVTVERGNSTKANSAWADVGRVDEQVTLASGEVLTIRNGVQTSKGARRCDVLTLQIDDDRFLLTTI